MKMLKQLVADIKNMMKTSDESAEQLMSEATKLADKAAKLANGTKARLQEQLGKAETVS
jgi:X-X-X-Leu-X-X-Gly heptad repeat protein